MINLFYVNINFIISIKKLIYFDKTYVYIVKSFIKSSVNAEKSLLSTILIFYEKVINKIFDLKKFY